MPTTIVQQGSTTRSGLPGGAGRLLSRLIRRDTDPNRARYQDIYLWVFAGSFIGCSIGLVLDVINKGAAFEPVWVPFILVLTALTVLSARRPQWLTIASMAMYLAVLGWVMFSTLTDPQMLGFVLPGLWAVLTMTAVSEPRRRGVMVGVIALANLFALPLLATQYGDYLMWQVVASVSAAVVALVVVGMLSSVIWRESLAELSNAGRHSQQLTKEMEAASAVLEQRVADRSAALTARSRELQERTEKLRESLEHRTRLSRELTELSQRDELTGLYNRRRFVAGMQEGLMRGGAVSLVIIDLDHFKRINDQFGHPAGDQVLIQVARALVTVAGEQDLLARMGGEEFALLLPGLGETDALLVAEVCRSRIREITWTGVLSGLAVTASIGVAGLRPGQLAPWELLMKRADNAMYAAKAAGRDRVVLDSVLGRG